MIEKGKRSNMNLIGIIVPVYNIKEQYLRECINSLLAQTYRNIKIYIVDDKSQDWCASLCDDIGGLDDRISVYHHQVNKGLPGARNTGMEFCDSDWVTFVDGDDWVDPDMCERFIHYLDESGNRPDVYIFSGYRSYPGHEEENKNEAGIKEYKTKAEVSQLQIDALTTFVIGKPDNIIPYDSAWGKFFYRDYLVKNDIQFRDLPFREDGMYFQEVTEYTSNVVYSPDLLYHYRMCGNSMVNIYRKNAPQELEKYLNMLWLFAERQNKEKGYYRAIFGAAFFAMQTVITNYYYNPKCDLGIFKRKRECKQLFAKKYFSGVFTEFPLNTIKRNHRIKMIMLRIGWYGGIQLFRNLYLRMHKRTCYE